MAEKRVTFKSNGGSGNDFVKTYTQAQIDAGVLTLPSLDEAGFSAPDGKEFIGWNTDKNATSGILEVDFGSLASLEYFAIYADLQTPVQPTQPPAEKPQEPQTPQENLLPNFEALSKEIETLLSDKSAWIEQVRLNLSINGELYRAFNAIQSNYLTSLDKLEKGVGEANLNAQETLKVQKDLQTELEGFKTLLSQKESKLDELEQRVQTNTTNALETLKTIETYKDKIDLDVTELATLKTEIKEAHKTFTQLATQKDELTKLLNQCIALAQEVERLKTTSLEAINTTLEDNKNELATATNTHKQELNTHKDSLESELSAHKDTLQSALDAGQEELRKKLAELEQSFIQKQALINESATLIEQKNRELVTKTEEAKQALETKKDELQKALETRKGELQTELETKKGELSTALDTEKNAHKQDMENVRNGYLQSINNQAIAELAGLKQSINEIALREQTYGSNFTSRSFTAGGTFAPVAGVSYYFVFVRGGTGGSHSTANGGVTSFGALLSANGGAGNANGAGQRGESKGAFVKISANVAMTIPSGGIIIVSYPQSFRR